MVYRPSSPGTRVVTTESPSGIFKTKTKVKLDSSEVARGIMSIETNFASLAVEEGWIYDIIATAPGYKTSNVTRGTFRFKR